MRNKFLPKGNLPTTGYPENTRSYWFLQDNEEAYEKKGNREFSKTDIVYRFNELGYRGNSFEHKDGIRIISIGCSYVFGFGLPEDDIFHQRFANRLSVETTRPVINWNLGMVGASNDYITRMLHLSVPLLNPDIVLINFTRLARREYVTAHGKLVSYLPNYSPKDPTGKEIYGHFDNLSSSHDDMLNLYRNYKSVESLLNGKCWFYSFMTKNEKECIAAHLDGERLIGSFLYNDWARDNEHPGRLSHEAMYHKYWEKFIQSGSLTTIRDLYGYTNV